MIPVDVSQADIEVTISRYAGDLAAAELTEEDYLALCLQGEGTIPERKIILEAKQKTLLEEKKRIEEAIAYIDWKQGFYDDVLSGRTQYYSNLLPQE